MDDWNDGHASFINEQNVMSEGDGKKEGRKCVEGSTGQPCVASSRLPSSERGKCGEILKMESLVPIDLYDIDCSEA